MGLKKEGQLTSAKEICDIYKTPFDPTSRVLQIMTQHGIMRAEQGAKGGYILIKDLRQFPLQELSDMIVGPIEIANCFHDDHSQCGITSTCHIIAPMLNLNEQIQKLFNTIMVSDLISSRHQDERAIREKKIKVPA